jgi:hypothetical protein
MLIFFLCGGFSFLKKSLCEKHRLKPFIYCVILFIAEQKKERTINKRT